MGEPYEVKVTLREWVEPPPFTCVICNREARINRWGPQGQHRAPICLSCSNEGGLQVRAAGMTRGDHFVLQRLKAIADELKWTAEGMRRGGRFSI